MTSSDVKVDLVINQLTRAQYLQLSSENRLCADQLYLISSDFIDADNQQIRNLAAPSSDTDATNKGYVEQLVQNLKQSLSSQYETRADLSNIHVKESDILLGYSAETREIVIETPNVTRRVTIDETQYSDYVRFRVGTTADVNLEYSGNIYEIYDFQLSSYNYYLPIPKNNKSSYITTIMHYEDVENVPETKWYVLNSQNIIKWNSIDGDTPLSGLKCMYQIQLIPNDISSYTGIMAVRNLSQNDSNLDYSSVGYYGNAILSNVSDLDYYYGYRKIYAGTEELVTLSSDCTLYEISDFQTSSYNYYLPHPMSSTTSELLIIQHYEDLSAVPQINWMVFDSENNIKWSSVDGDSPENGNKYLYSIQILPNDVSSYSGIMAVKKLNQ